MKNFTLIHALSFERPKESLQRKVARCRKIAEILSQLLKNFNLKICIRKFSSDKEIFFNAIAQEFFTAIFLRRVLMWMFNFKQ